MPGRTWRPPGSRRTSRTRPGRRRTARRGWAAARPPSSSDPRATGSPLPGARGSRRWRSRCRAGPTRSTSRRRRRCCCSRRGRCSTAAEPGAGGIGSLPLGRAPYAGVDMHDAPETAAAERTVYLDHAATTPMLPEAIEAMTAHLREVGNPSSLHASGRAARRIVEESRETIAQALNCRPGEVVFTSGGTEADNLALKGLFWSRHGADPARVRILASAIEHHAVLDALHWLADEEHAEVELLPVDRRGRLDVEAYRATV